MFKWLLAALLLYAIYASTASAATTTTAELEISILPADHLIINPTPDGIVIADGRFVDPSASTGWTVRIDCEIASVETLAGADAQPIDLVHGPRIEGNDVIADPGYGNGAYLIRCDDTPRAITVSSGIMP